jgi:hypothetical protein
MLEERGYRRDQIATMSRWYALRVLMHPRKSGDGVQPLEPQYAPGPPADTDRERLRRKLLRMRYHDSAIRKILGG